MNRRGFLGAILAAAVAPAIVRADSLMRIIPREQLVLHKAAQIGITEAPMEVFADGDMLALMEARIAAALLALGRRMEAELYIPSSVKLIELHFDGMCPPNRIYVQRGTHG